jgi:hypothetical protein
MKQIRCAHCGCLFDPNPRVKNQRYCSEKECQRARKRLWQKQKLATDPDYKANQRDCQKTWRDNNPDYWREYRERNEKYTERNRNRQRERRRGGGVAKMDASGMDLALESGIYYIVPESADVAKMDASAKKVRLIPVA